MDKKIKQWCAVPGCMSFINLEKRHFFRFPKEYDRYDNVLIIIYKICNLIIYIYVYFHIFKVNNMYIYTFLFMNFHYTLQVVEMDTGIKKDGFEIERAKVRIPKLYTMPLAF